ncbi:MAG: tRNA(Ile)-lysidine synthase [Holosporales bacterium]
MINLMVNISLLKEKLANALSHEPIIAVAVSGGADSMALLMLTQAWAKEKNKKIVALTVDHRLRAESTREAEKVKEWVVAQGVEHQILTWNHAGVDSKIQETARHARYEQMIAFCKQENISTLLTAHHLNDQVETFFMRLNKGSGVQGLCCMHEISEKDGIRIFRPLLDVASADLKAYLVDKNLPYVNDPSNDNVAYERIRWRKNIEALMQEDFSLDQFAKSLTRLQEADSFIEENALDLFNDIVLWHENYAEIDYTALLQTHAVVAKRMLTKVLKCLNLKYYAPSAHALDECIQLLPSLKATSLGGCVLTKKGGKIIVTVDPRSANDSKNHSFL